MVRVGERLPGFWTPDDTSPHFPVEQGREGRIMEGKGYGGGRGMKGKMKDTGTSGYWNIWILEHLGLLEESGRKDIALDYTLHFTLYILHGI